MLRCHMNLINRRSPIYLAAVTAIVGGAMASQAYGSRLPTRTEYGDIKRASMAYCEKSEPSDSSGCVWRGHVRVSTIDRRFAYSESMGVNGGTSGILRRANPRSHRWTMVQTYGNVVEGVECQTWWHRVNRRVVHDLKIRGSLREGGRRC